MDDLQRFQKRMEQELDQFLNPEKKPPKRPQVAAPDRGFQVQLIVRSGPLKPDTLFIHDSESISRFEAKMEAEKAARDQGWAIVGRVHDIVPR